ALDGTGAIDAHLALAPLAATDVRALAPRSELATDLRARVRMRGPWHALAVAAHADLGRGGRLHARAALDVTARPVAYAARLAFARLDPGAVVPRLPRAEADGQLAFRGAGGAHRVRGVVRTPLGEAALQGRLAPGTPPAYRLFARVSFPRLEALDARVTGSASGRVRLDGRGFDAADRHARARVVLTHAMIRGVPLEHGAARAVVDGARARLASARVTGPELHANASGNLDLARSVADLTLRGLADPECRRAGDTDRARVSARGAGEEGRTLALAATVERTAARTTGRLEQATLALPGGPPWQLAAPAAFTLEDGLRTAGVTLTAGGQRIVLAGRVGLRGASDATLAVERLALGPLCVLTGGPRCAGQVTARAALTGTAAA